MNKQPRITILLLTAMICTALVGCSGLVPEEPTIAFLPTLTPSIPVTATLENPPTLTSTLTLTPTITLTPRITSTSLIGPTQEFEEGDATPTVVGINAQQIPVIKYFVATPLAVKPGDPVLLFWSTEDAASAAVYRLNPDGSPGRTWAVQTEGSLTVVPRSTGQDEIYILSVTNGITTIERSITITISCEAVWFFDPVPEGGCPQEAPLAINAIYQQFERGQMIWLSNSGQIIVLFDDSPDNIDEETPAWTVLPDTFVEGQPQEDPNINPPEGFLEPIRGFGNAWRQNESVRDRLGWAITQETGYVTRYLEVVGEEGKLFIYFSNDRGEVYQLEPDGLAWSIVGVVSDQPTAGEEQP